MKVIFLLQKEAWFIEHADAWYRMHDRNQIGLALSGLALSVVDQHDLVEQPHQAGIAKVTQSDVHSMRVSLSTPDKIQIDTLTIVLDKHSLINVNWITKKFRDGWICADSQVTLDNVGAMYLQAYLPGSDDSEGKTLTISNAQSGDVREVWMARDRKTRIPVMERGSKGKVHLRLTCEPESVDQSSEPRQLGFVLVAEESHPA